MCNQLASLATLINCTFNGNYSDWGGGLFSNIGCTAIITNCTFRGNTAGTGGGLLNNGSTTTASIDNGIFWQNTDEGGMDESAQISNANGPVTYSCIQGLDTIQGVGNIADDPQFVSGPIGNWSTDGVYGVQTLQITFTDAMANWTPDEHRGELIEPNTDDSSGVGLQLPIITNTATTLTVWADSATVYSGVSSITAGMRYEIHDWHLTAAAPCVDTGDPDLVVDPAAPHDLDGEPRIMACRVDMGVDELTASPPLSGDFDRNGVLDLNDLQFFVAALLRPTLADACLGDLNGDGALDGDDIQLLVDTLLSG